jgi:hypothetical protein
MQESFRQSIMLCFFVSDTMRSATAFPCLSTIIFAGSFANPFLTAAQKSQAFEAALTD